jgi:apolipoprotein N-acyltransferase
LQYVVSFESVADVVLVSVVVRNPVDAMVIFVYFAVIALAWTRKRTRWAYVVLLPAVWLTLEWIQAQGDLRMTAQHLGQTLGTVPYLVQFADLGGPYGVGWVLLASNALLHDAWRPGSRSERLRPIAAFVVLMSAVVGYDAWAWAHPPASSGSLRIAFLQPNVPLNLKMDSADDLRQDKLLADLTRKAASMNAEVVIWPETARPRPLYKRPDSPETYAMPEVQALAKSAGVTIVAPGASWSVDFAGGLIQTAFGRISRRGGPCTKRSG